jgi:DNA gyrase subunit B
MNIKSHIICLLLTFFFKYYKNLINDGKIFVANTPLFSVKYSGKRYYFKDEKSKDSFISGKKGITITRFKGLGKRIAPLESNF